MCLHLHKPVRGIYFSINAHKINSLKLPTGFDKWQGWTKTIKHMQVLLFFGQGVKNAKQINTILQQALVMLELWYFPLSLIFRCFNHRSCLGRYSNLFPSSTVCREVWETSWLKHNFWQVSGGVMLEDSGFKQTANHKQTSFFVSWWKDTIFLRWFTWFTF